MRTRKQQHQPITSRLDYGNTYNYANKMGGHLAYATSNKKQGHEEGLNSIGPWAVQQFNSFKNSLQNSSTQNKKKKVHGKNRKFKISKTKNNHDVPNEEETVIIHVDEGDHVKQTKRRTKTEVEANNCITRIRLNTIQVSNNLHMIPSQKYFTEEAQQRKMSMNKFRTTLQETSRSKSTNINLNFFQTKTDIQKKIQSRMTGNVFEPNFWNEGQIVNKRLKTIESENESPLMFFFEAKNNKNMMEREKNIMKIRNLSKKNKRVRTEGI